jgi:decaprenylphospho-beta-D-ribofuranose 2-oxidase
MPPRTDTTGRDGARRLTGWGRTAPTVAEVRAPRSTEQVVDALLCAGPRGVLARGLGRSYGDAAQNAGGAVLDMTGLDRIHRVDTDEATVDVEAGVSLDRLLRTLIPLGLTVPVQPGTRQVSVGGAIAADVHGKNHHVDGSFGRHVRALDLVTADGTTRTLRPDDPDPDLFWATVGGMGLTGVVVRATVSCRRVDTSYVVTDTSRGRDLEEVMDLLVAGDADHDYSVAWFDSVTRGRSRGRGVVMHGRDARLDDLTPKQRQAPRRLPSERTVRMPSPLPGHLVNRWTGRAFNEVWFRKAPRRPETGVEGVFGFFHPLDAVSEWNSVYGPHGFCQYQLVVPFGAEEVVRRVVQRIADTGHVSCLNVLKRFGPGTPSPLSFPMPGWTLAMDLAVRTGLDRLLTEFDELVAGAGGRVYLAKDARLAPGTAAVMYPRLAEFAAIRDKADPQGVFVSDLARRLHLGGHP